MRAVDAAGTEGVWSDVARVAKTWPNQIGGTRFSATPAGPSASFTELNPYLFWNPVPGAKSYDVQVSPGDQFNNVIFFGTDLPQPFATPAAVGALPDDTYSWRVRAHDPNDNVGPWTVASTFTKAWGAPTEIAPAAGATTERPRPAVDAGRRRPALPGADHRPPEQLGRRAPQGRHDDRGDVPHAHVPGGAGEVDGLRQPLVAGAPGHQRRRTAAGRSTGSRVNWQYPGGGTTSTAALSSTGDSATGLSPRLDWTPVTGQRTCTAWTSRPTPTSTTCWSSESPPAPRGPRASPLPDNQIGSGYYWRVIWGTGVTIDDPQWSVAEDDGRQRPVPKQTQVTLGSPANGGVVSDPPLLSWGSVPGIARYDVELSQDGKFGTGDTRTASIFGLGAVPGSMSNGEKRLPDGTWNWRARAVDGGDKGQSWSSTGTFTLSSQRPTQKLPNDGASVVYSPLITWSPVAGACSYDVQVSRDSELLGRHRRQRPVHRPDRPRAAGEDDHHPRRPLLARAGGLLRATSRASGARRGASAASSRRTST